MNNIQSLVRELQNNFINGKTVQGKYVTWSLYENIEKIEAYANSKHISGDTDALGRDKPFFNITTAAENIWYRATDIDRKDIRIKPSNIKSITPAFALNIHLQDYMRRENIGEFLNTWGRGLARYGSSVLKFVEKEGRLHTSVVPWNRLIVDSVDFENNPKIEKIYMTPGQLSQATGYDKEVVDSLLSARTTRKNMDGQRKDNLSDYIELYEIHGLLPLSYLTGDDKDDNEYVQQMHVITYLAGEKEGEYDDFTLVSGREAKDPYMITHLIKEDGRVQGKGAVEHLFDAQWMVNHSMKAIKDQLDLASKLIFQTSDPSFVGQNVLEAIETGDILIHSMNQPLTQMANNSHDITSLQNYAGQWKALSQEITSTPDSIAGNTMPSGTAYRQVAVLQQEAHSLFEIMVENKGLAIEEMMRRFILPFLLKKINSKRELVALLSDNDVRELDEKYIRSETNKIVNEEKKKTILSGKIFEGMDESAVQQNVQENLQAQGKQRFIVPSEIEDVTWSDLLKDIEYSIDVEVTGESSNKEMIMTTLTTLLQTVAGNPNILIDPVMKTLFSKIIEQTGVVSSIELYKSPMQPQQIQPAPAVTPVGRT